MISIKILRTAVIFLATASALSSCHRRQSRQIIRNYQYETVYPGNRDIVEVSRYSRNRYAVNRQPHILPVEAAGSFQAKPATLPIRLFTPNTIEQPAETQGQIDEYRKALEEERREAQDYESSVESQTVGTGGLEEATKGNNFVIVNSKDYNYNYRI